MGAYYGKSKGFGKKNCLSQWVCFCVNWTKEALQGVVRIK